MLDTLAQESDFNEPRVLECNHQAPGGDNLIKARLSPTKMGLKSRQVMKMLALAGLHFQERGASSCGNLAALPTSWGQVLSPQSQGHKAR